MAEIRWMDNVRPKIRVLLEDVPASGVYVATAFDEEQQEVCSASSTGPHQAVQRCLQKLPNGKYDADIVVDVMNPDAEHDE